MHHGRYHPTDTNINNATRANSPNRHEPRAVAPERQAAATELGRIHPTDMDHTTHTQHIKRRSAEMHHGRCHTTDTSINNATRANSPNNHEPRAVATERQAAGTQLGRIHPTDMDHSANIR